MAKQKEKPTAEQVQAQIEMQQAASDAGSAIAATIETDVTVDEETGEIMQNGKTVVENNSKDVSKPVEYEDEFRPMNNFVSFVDFKNQNEFIGVYLGAGKTLNAGQKNETKTHCFKSVEDGMYYFVPAWKALDELKNIQELGAVEVKIVYGGKHEAKDGTPYHRVRIFSRKLKTPLQINVDFHPEDWA